MKLELKANTHLMNSYVIYNKDNGKYTYAREGQSGSVTNFVDFCCRYFLLQFMDEKFLYHILKCVTLVVLDKQYFSFNS